MKINFPFEGDGVRQLRDPGDVSSEGLTSPGARQMTDPSKRRLIRALPKERHPAVYVKILSLDNSSHFESPPLKRA